MNEIDVLRRWQPDPVDAESDAMQSARDRLDETMTEVGMGTLTRVRPAGRRFAGRALIAAAVTTVLVVGTVLVLQRQVDRRIDRVHRTALPAGTLDDSSVPYPMTILVVGSDSRAFVNDAHQENAFGSASSQTGQRADVMALVRLTETTTTAVWIPRDILVDDHGTTRQLNSFLDIGPQALIEALRTNLHVDVNHYVQVNFPAFIKVVDAIGTVHLNLATPVRDIFSGLDVPNAGCTAFDGDRALAWVRSRHLETFVNGMWRDASGRSDLDRVARQQQFVQILLAKIRADVGTDLGRANDVAEPIIRALTVDSRFDTDQIRALVRRFVRDDQSSWTFRTVPVVPAPSDRNRLVLNAPTGDDLLSPVRAAPTPSGPGAGFTVSGEPVLGTAC